MLKIFKKKQKKNSEEKELQQLEHALRTFTTMHVDNLTKEQKLALLERIKKK